MATALRADTDARLAALDKTPGGVDPADIVEVVESVLGSISGDRSGVNLRLYEDIEALARFIQSAKAEVTSLRTDEINAKFLPAASDELNAIVGATEQATNAIFEAVETIETASNEMDPEAAAPLTDAVTRIYEACSFQDITGQRITKIVNVLQEVETRVAALLRTFGAEAPERAPLETAKAAPAPDVEAEKKSDNDLMSGPQLPGNAMSQDDIDALMASFD